MSKWVQTLGLLSFVFVSARLHAEPRIVNYEAFGDSISTGAMAGWSLPQATQKEFLDFMDPAISTTQSCGYLSMGCWWGESKGYLLNKFNFSNYSWAVGTDVQSFSRYLQEFYGSKAKVHSRLRAVLGSRTDNFLDQVDDSLQEQKQTHYELDYASVLVGANDYCESKAVNIDDATANLKKGVRQLLDKTRTKVIFVQIPDANGLRPFAKAATMKGYVTCQTLWNRSIFPCHRILGADKEWAENEVNHWTYRWKVTAGELEQEYPGRFINVPLDEKPTMADVAADCFHPSVHGQQRLSDYVTRKVTSEKFIQ